MGLTGERRGRSRMLTEAPVYQQGLDFARQLDREDPLAGARTHSRHDALESPGWTIPAS